LAAPAFRANDWHTVKHKAIPGYMQISVLPQRGLYVKDLEQVYHSQVLLATANIKGMLQYNHNNISWSLRWTAQTRANIKLRHCRNIYRTAGIFTAKVTTTFWARNCSRNKTSVNSKF